MNMEMNLKKIFVITGSARKDSNSFILANNFIKGAKEAGHQVVRFDAALRNVHPCIACDACRNNEKACIFKDDFEAAREDIINADVVVFATPIYYFNMSAQIKTVIDRFYSIEDIMKPKKTVLLVTLADIDPKTPELAVLNYEAIIDVLGWQDAGKIIAYGVWAAGAVNSTDYPQKAYELGKSI